MTFPTTKQPQISILRRICKTFSDSKMAFQDNSSWLRLSGLLMLTPSESQVGRFLIQGIARENE